MERLICTDCGKEFSPDEKIWRCDCGAPLDLDFEPAFPLDRIRERKPTMWRYREAIPVRLDENIVSFDEGFTPLIPVDFEGRTVLIKQDHLFPTGSFKDRGASVLVSKMKELKVEHAVEDSSGNAGCAIAAYCAKAGIECDIFVPASASAGKLAQIRLYGARLRTVAGSRDDVADAAIRAAERHYYAGHSWNPFFFHGTKTFAFEVCEQMGWKTPDCVVLPAANGTLALGTYIGFGELLQAGIIDRIPRIVAVQASNCAPLAEAFERGMKHIPPVEKKKTLAEGIAVAKPARGMQIVRTVLATGGFFVTVEEDEILGALRQTAGKGHYIEPTSAATIAGLKKYLERSEPSETVVSVFTGHGLKATEKILGI